MLLPEDVHATGLLLVAHRREIGRVEALLSFALALVDDADWVHKSNQSDCIQNNTAKVVYFGQLSKNPDKFYRQVIDIRPQRPFPGSESGDIPHDPVTEDRSQGNRQSPAAEQTAVSGRMLCLSSEILQPGQHT